VRWLATGLLFAMLASGCSGEGTANPTELTQSTPVTTAIESSTTTPEAQVVTTTTVGVVSDSGSLELVEDFVAAFFTYDAEALRAATYLPSQYYLQTSFDVLNYEALGDVTCEAEFARPSCTFNGEDDVSRLLGFQYAETWFFFIVSDDIANVSRILSEETEEVHAPFREWVSDNMPELFGEGGPCGGFPFEMAAECAAATLSAAQEYVQSDG